MIITSPALIQLIFIIFLDLDGNIPIGCFVVLHSMPENSLNSFSIDTAPSLGKPTPRFLEILSVAYGHKLWSDRSAKMVYGPCHCDYSYSLIPLSIPPIFLSPLLNLHAPPWVRISPYVPAPRSPPAVYPLRLLSIFLVNSLDRLELELPRYCCLAPSMPKHAGSSTQSGRTSSDCSPPPAPRVSFCHPSPSAR